MHLAFLDLGLPPSELAEGLRAKCPDDLDAELVAAIGTRTGQTLRWLRGHGARFMKAGPEPWQRFVLAPPRPFRPRLVWPGRGPDVLLRGLTQAFVALGGALVRGARAIDVLPRAGGVWAVTAQIHGQPEIFEASAVILADGGYQADANQLRQWVTPTPELLVQRNAQTGRGFSLGLAGRLGLRVSDLGHFYGHLHSIDARREERLWPYPTVDDLGAAGLVVGGDGRRVADEGLGGVFLANAIVKLPQAYVVVDETIWQSIGRKTRIVPCNPFLAELGATMFTGDTIAAAALAAGLPPEALEREVTAHNGGAAMSPVRSAGKFGRVKLAQAPFRVIPVCAGITYTMGGLLIDQSCNVMRVDGGPMHGLYAVGGAVGDTEGGRTAFYLGGLCKAAVLGCLAGESAAVLR